MAHAPALPTMSGLDAAICDGLGRDGIFVTSLDALGLAGSAEMLSTACAMAADYRASAHAAPAAARNS